MEKETLNYLKSDVEGLLEAILKFNDSIFSKYKLNITKFKTLSGLALAAFTSSYLPVDLISDFKLIKGNLESEIRSSYFGGNVEVFINEINNGYLYDINSQYPTAMLNDMPVGDPVLSLESNLDKIFGFVYGEITCPDEEILQVPFIKNKSSYLRLNSCPRGKFKRLIFSEEIKYALLFGYTIDIEYCYQFNRGKFLFDLYVEDHYEIKTSETDPVKKIIAKLFLNTLYGRMGINETENVMKIVDKKEAENLNKNSNVSILSELNNNKFLVSYKGKINNNLRKLFKVDPLVLEVKNKEFDKDELISSGLNKPKQYPSAVHIAAAISSYARILINEFKIIPGNPCIMSDTDSVVLSKPLNPDFIGKELGQMKLEHEIKKGIFLRKKLYYILNIKDQEVIKASGLDSSKLNYNSFINLLNGESVEISGSSFKVNWKDLTIKLVEMKYVIKGLNKKIKKFYNTRDVNFKSISFPIKYNLIIHPLFLYLIDSSHATQKSENKKENLIISRPYNNTNLIVSASLASHPSKTTLNNKDKIIIFIFLITLLTSFLLFFFH